MNRFTAYDFRGQRMTLRQIAEATGIYQKTLLYRFNQCGSMDEAASRPVLTRQEVGQLAAQRRRYG